MILNYKNAGKFLPIETFHDTENNRVYTHTDELGTYCLMDMEVWLENLGISIESVPASTNSSPIGMMKAAPASGKIDETPVDVAFLIESAGRNESIFTSQKKTIAGISKRLFETHSNVRIRIIDYKVNEAHLIDKSKMWFTDYESLNKAMSGLKYTKSNYYCNCSKAYSLLFDLEDKYRVNAAKFVIHMINYAVTDNIWEINCRIALPGNKVNSSEVVPTGWDHSSRYTQNMKPVIEKTGGLLLTYSSETEQKLYDHIIENIAAPQTEFSALLPSKWGKVKLENILDPNNKTDTDKDGLSDWKEIDTERIRWDYGGKVKLPTIAECLEFPEKPYAESGLDRFKSEQYAMGGMPSSAADKCIDNALNSTRVLPVFSDPTLSDGDGDGFDDINDHYPLAIEDFDITKHNLDLSESGYYVCDKCSIKITPPDLQDITILSEDDYLKISCLKNEFMKDMQKQYGDEITVEELSDAYYSSLYIYEIEKIRSQEQYASKYDFKGSNGKYYSDFLETVNTEDLLYKYDNNGNLYYTYYITSWTEDVNDDNYIKYFYSYEFIPASLYAVGIALSFSSNFFTGTVVSSIISSIPPIIKDEYAITDLGWTVMVSAIANVFPSSSIMIQGTVKISDSTKTGIQEKFSDKHIKYGDKFVYVSRGSIYCGKYPNSKNVGWNNVSTYWFRDGELVFYED